MKKMKNQENYYWVEKNKEKMLHFATIGSGREATTTYFYYYKNHIYAIQRTGSHSFLYHDMGFKEWWELAQERFEQLNVDMNEVKKQIIIDKIKNF